MGLLEWIQRRVFGAPISLGGGSPVLRGAAWPPKELEDRRRVLDEYRRRYHNDAGTLVQHNPYWHHTERQKTYTPVPMARELCRYSAALLFSKQPRISFERDPELLERVIEGQVGFHGFLQETAEAVAREGRGAFRVMRDDRTGGVPFISWVPDDRILWNVIHGRFVLGGAIFYEYPTGFNGETVYRMFESHEIGAITRTLFKGSAYALGPQVDLYSATESADGQGPYISETDPWVREERRYTLSDLEGMEQTEQTGMDALTLVPWRNVPGSHSDLKGLDSLLDRLDEAVSGGVLKERRSHPLTFADPSLANGAGDVDLSGVVFTRRGGSLLPPKPGDDPKAYAEIVQPDFGQAEQEAHARYLVELVTSMAGYSPSSWQSDQQGGGAESGRALRIKLTKTLTTRAGKERMALDAVGQTLATALCWLDGGSKVSEYRAALEIQLGDGLPVDPAEDASEAVQWRAAEGISTEDVVRMRRPDLDDDGVREEVARIKDEEPQAPAEKPTTSRLPDVTQPEREEEGKAGG